MIPSLKEIEFQAKQEGTTNDQTKFSKATTSSSTSTRQWVGSRNPRIVRVSRSFGGKDRHSKVCTIRGLRDRRIRLSVPTAIQLYDLQDRLGLGQPSKVIDWLLDVTKLDIDKLPPLQMPQGNFSQFFPCDHRSNNTQFFDANNPSFLKDIEDQTMMGGSSSKAKHSWDFGDLRSKNKEVNEEQDDEDDEDQSMHGIENFNNNAQISAQNFFPMANQSSISGFNLNPNYYQWDPSNLSLSQFGAGSHGFSSQSDHHQDPHHNGNVAHVGPQLLFCPPTAIAPSLFPTYSPYFGTNHHLENDPRSQMINHFQLSSSSSQHYPQSFPLNGISSTQPEKDKNASL